MLRNVLVGLLGRLLLDFVQHHSELADEGFLESVAVNLLLVGLLLNFGGGVTRLALFTPLLLGDLMNAECEQVLVMALKLVELQIEG